MLLDWFSPCVCLKRSSAFKDGSLYGFACALTLQQSLSKSKKWVGGCTTATYWKQILYIFWYTFKGNFSELFILIYIKMKFCIPLQLCPNALSCQACNVLPRRDKSSLQNWKHLPNENYQALQALKTMSKSHFAIEIMRIHESNESELSWWSLSSIRRLISSLVCRSLLRACNFSWNASNAKRIKRGIKTVTTNSPNMCTSVEGHKHSHSVVRNATACHGHMRNSQPVCPLETPHHRHCLRHLGPNDSSWCFLKCQVRNRRFISRFSSELMHHLDLKILKSLMIHSCHSPTEGCRVAANVIVSLAHFAK